MEGACGGVSQWDMRGCEGVRGRRGCRGILGIELRLPSNHLYGDFLSLSLHATRTCMVQGLAAHDAVPRVRFQRLTVRGQDLDALRAVQMDVELELLDGSLVNP
jgi:hypothetical protein